MARIKIQESGFAVVASDGTFEVVESTEKEAAKAAKSFGYRVVEPDRTWDDSAAGLMVPNGKINDRLAHRMIENIRVDADAVRKMSLQEAVERLAHLVPENKGKPVRAYLSVDGFVTHLLGQNYKTAKKHLEYPTSVMGLNLAPHMAWWHNVGKAWGVKPVNLCAGASPECRSSCLVNCGHNVGEQYNDIIKLARTSWFLLDPEAFCRLLIGAIEEHVHTCKRNGMRPFIRLNVLSDVPWELVFPELFTDYFNDVVFYDYTKVPDRVTPRNYNLTFSYSGHNIKYCDSEINDYGRRVAVVFLCESFEVVRYSDLQPLGEFDSKDKAQKFMKSKGMYTEVPSNKQASYYHGYVRGKFPDSFMDMQVVDGDVSDVRPLDPSPCIIGLTYKLPRVRTVSTIKYDAVNKDTKSAFLVPVQKINGQFVVAQVPRDIPQHYEAEKADQLPAGTHLPVVK